MVQEDVLPTCAARSSKIDEAELTWLVDNELTKSFYSIKGVGEVSRIGGIDREIHVDLDPDIMASLGITAVDISSQLRAVQADLSGGRGEVGSNRQTIRTLGALHSAGDIAKLSLPVPNGPPIRLDQVAKVSDGFADPSSLAYLDGKPVIAVQIKRANGYSDLDVISGLRKTLEAFNKKHPEAFIAEAFNSVQPTVDNYDQSMRILYEGAFITILVVWCFLRKWRATLISAAALPLSLLPAFLIMSLAGFSLNVISLLALSLVVGILVDDAIVEVENIIRHARMGKAPYEAALEAANEIGLAVIATSLTLVAVFLPTAFMGGMFGIVFRQFGITASAAVTVSLLVARMLTPMMAANWMKPLQYEKKKDGPLMRVYMVVARKCLNHRKLTLSLVCAVIGLSLLLTAFLGAVFMPASDISQTRIVLTSQPGSSIDQTSEAARHAAALVAAVPDVKSVFTAVGIAGGGEHDLDVADLNSATLTAILTPISERNRKQGEIEQNIRLVLKNLAGVRVTVGSEENNVLGITLASNDIRALGTMAATLENQLRTLKGTGSVTSSTALQAPEVQITPNFQQAAVFGVTSQDMATVARIATSGDYTSELSKLNLPERQIPVRVRLEPSVREHLDAISQLQVPGSRGSVNLGAIAGISIGGSPTSITRIDRARNLTVSVELNGRNIEEVMDEALRLPILKNLPPGVSLVEQGGMQQISQMFTTFGLAMTAGIFCVYAVLVLLFHDFLQPVTILMAIPLSLGGALLPLVMTGSNFSMAAIIGLLMLMGITTKNSILLVEYAIRSREKGMNRIESLMDACHKRARPILMTTLAMIGGMLPIVMGFTQGDPSFRRPMAIVVIGGLITSTFLSLIVIPVIFTFIDDLKLFLSRIFKLNKKVASLSIKSEYDKPLKKVPS